MTSRPPSNDAAPDAGTARRLLDLRDRAGLPGPADTPDPGATRYEHCAAGLAVLAADEEWRSLAHGALDRAKWRNRDGIAVWSAALLTTGESADVLNRLARLNEGVSVVQEALRRGAPEDLSAAWFDWLGEALSLREDLYVAARGGLPDEWPAFRAAARPADRELLAVRREQARTIGDVRRLLAQPLRPLGH